MEQLGGKPAPACGFGYGVERVLMLLAENPPPVVEVLDAYVIFSEARKPPGSLPPNACETMRLASARYAGRQVASFKSQMKKADVSGARFAIILGAEEVSAGRSRQPLRCRNARCQ
jgi:histidyl-tRNA synthetase